MPARPIRASRRSLGANLAQLQIGVILDTWLDRVVDYEVEGLEPFNTALITGVEKLDLTVVPSRP